MTKFLITFIFIISSSYLLAQGKYETEKAKKAIELTQQGVEFFKKNGKEKLLEEIAKTEAEKGQFSKGEFYLFAFDFEGKCLARGDGNKKLTGMNMLDLVDTNGKGYVKEMIAVVKKDGKGWVDYSNNNPATKTIQNKHSYVEKAGDIWIGCGFYE